MQDSGVVAFQRALAFAGFFPAVDGLGTLLEAEQLDDAGGDALAVDDVHLRRHVAGRHHALHDHAGDGVGRFDVDDQRGGGRVFLGQDQADDQGGQHRDAKNRQRQLAACPEDEEKLLKSHAGLSVIFCLEEAFLDVEHIVGLNEVGLFRRDDLHLAVRAAPVNAQAAFGAANGQAGALGQALEHGHVAFEAVGATALDFAVDVENRGAMNVDDVAAGHRHIEIGVAAEEHGRDVDFPAEGLAVANAGKNDDIGAAGGDGTTGRGQHVGQPGVAGFDGVAARPIDHAENGNLVALELHEQDIDLRLLHEAAVAQLVGDGQLGLGNRQTTEVHGADQRIGDGAAFGNAGFNREVRALEHADLDGVAGPQAVVDRLALRLRAGDEAKGEENAEEKSV